MNEKIKALYEQAMEQCVSNNMAWEELNPQKFAELIIKECTTICKDTAEKHYNPVLYRHESIAAFTCHRKIKEHFGVEE